MTSRKKQHYTPNFILRGFVDDSTKTLWVWDKAQERCRPVRGTKSKRGALRYAAFAENHYYTVVDSCGNRDLSVEDHLGGIEYAAAPVIADLITCARAGLYLPLDFPRIEHLARFLWAQHMRSPYARSESVNSEESRSMFRDLAVEAASILGPDRGFLVIKHGDPTDVICHEAGNPHGGLSGFCYRLHETHEPRVSACRRPSICVFRHQRQAMPHQPGTQTGRNGIHGRHQRRRSTVVQT